MRVNTVSLREIGVELGMQLHSRKKIPRTLPYYSRQLFYMVVIRSIITRNYYGKINSSGIQINRCAWLVGVLDLLKKTANYLI